MRIDARGLRCPLPAIRLARALREGAERVEIVADEVAPSLRWASADIRRNEFKGGGGAPAGGGGGRPVPNEAPPAYDMDEEPF